MKLAVFDLDGTILDTAEDLNASLNYVLRKYGLPERSVADTKRFLGNGIRRLIELGAGEGVPAATLDAMFADFKTHYAVHCLDQTRPYEGIPALLVALRAAGVKTAVVSNKADFAVRELVDRFFPGLFDYAVGEREGVRRKPCPDSVNEALKQLGAAREDALYIGDSEVDIATAENAGLPCVCVAWGFRTPEQLRQSGAQRIVYTIDELKAILI
ncbi:MAG: HAD-IA family hydrolase [Clostridia bacterium]|nr:HAD-IA family hydrolase [Clostridia bacterium]